MHAVAHAHVMQLDLPALDLRGRRHCTLSIISCANISPVRAAAAVMMSRLPAYRGRKSPSPRSEEHTSELQSLMRISYAVFCLKKKKTTTTRIMQLSQNLSNKD